MNVGRQGVSPPAAPSHCPTPLLLLPLPAGRAVGGAGDCGGGEQRGGGERGGGAGRWVWSVVLCYQRLLHALHAEDARAQQPGAPSFTQQLAPTSHNPQRTRWQTASSQAWCQAWPAAWSRAWPAASRRRCPRALRRLMSACSCVRATSHQSPASCTRCWSRRRCRCSRWG